ncbi:terminase gpA endonuclease subunit, partial [Salmonella enterica]|uniref:terminase gpA endonuclease subunit n=1 Tax=Salmonella enterica TaxID=28901 RepID=UPI003FA77DB7
MHFSSSLPTEFYQQLTAEVRVPQKTARGVEFRWVNPKRARNEVLDCTVYAVFCTHQLELHLYSDKMWSRLESALQPDLFTQPAADPTQPQANVPREAMPRPQAPRAETH